MALIDSPVDWQTDRLTTCIFFVYFRKKEILHLVQNRNLLLCQNLPMYFTWGRFFLQTNARF